MLQEGTTARVDFVTSCSDNIDTSIQADCNATSGSEFPVGVTTVTCSCEDLSQNTDRCSFTVTVKDVTHPMASCPNDIDTDARLQEGTTARVDFVTSCSDNIDTSIQADCNATSGSDFPFGVTIVNCSCQDISQNTDECSFNVIVKGVPKVTFTTEVPILSTMKPKENQIPVIILPVSIAIASFAVLSILLRFIEDTFRRSGSNKNKDPETPPDSPTSQGPKKINGTALRELY
ncbi:exported protein of unknown function [Apostichopus japonicus]|uniref:HYR domain-containing protein n=2 Tax=Stichopus japonicus TaxID=307972 RepID=A0A2G8KIA4_STIJA|nr:exported protein of unknown function [Apostichopus japonicus]